MDTVDGGKGKDKLEGGKGAEVFMCDTEDTIKDFNSQEGDYLRVYARLPMKEFRIQTNSY